MVIVDTSAWVPFLRSPDSPEGQAVGNLLRQGEVSMVGVVLAEVLQGARTEGERLRLEGVLRALPYMEATQDTWARAGEMAFHLRNRGRLIPLTDLLVAALAIENDGTIFALDRHFQTIPGVKLHGAESA
ncbi:MAG: PIN domain-containing protein [Chloroflexi bacterium]|nr:PIN domain-containing protein [Chloroflexota bacterium]